MKSIRLSSNITLTQLEYIVSVDEFRHFVTAAEKCFVTQPTLSMQIHKLEAQLDIKIFDRSRTPVVPTDIGARIITQARRVLLDAERITEIIKEEKNEISGELKLGILPTIAPYLLPLFVSKFTKDFPDVELHVTELVTNDIVERLVFDRLDAGILVTPINDERIIEKPMYYEQFVSYVSNQSLASREEYIDDGILNEEQVWIINEGHCFREQVLSICDLRDKKRERQPFQYESGSIEATKRLVDKYGGITLLPELAALDLNKSEIEKLRSFKRPIPTREVSIVMYRNHVKKIIIEALFKQIWNALPQEIKTRKNPNVIEWK